MLCIVWERRKKDLTCLDRATTSRTLRTIKSSTCTSHFSTAPLASDVEMFWISWTRSPSLLYMAWERAEYTITEVHHTPRCQDNNNNNNMCDWLAWISRFGRKSSLEMPSKHFFRCGCTSSGSLVSDRISSISSLDRKKNLAAAAVTPSINICDITIELDKKAMLQNCFHLPWKKETLLLQIGIQSFHDAVQEVVGLLQFL